MRLVSKKKVQWLCWFTAIITCFFVAAAWYVAGKSIDSANRVVGPVPERMPVETLRIESESGCQLATWYVDNEDADATIVLLHLMRGSRRSMEARMHMFYEAGFSLVAIDFQAHGESTGDNITFGHLEKHDAEAAIEFARQRKPGHKIGVVGRSLGGAAFLFSDSTDVDAVVLESVYATIEDAVYNRVEKQLGWLKHAFAPALLLQLQPRLGIDPDDMRPIDRLPMLKCPVLIAGSTEDQYTPVEETKKLFESANSPKQLVIFEGIAHKDFSRGDPVFYRTHVLPFLIEHLRHSKETIESKSTTD